MKINIFVPDLQTGLMVKDIKPTLSVAGRNIDECIKAAKRLLEERGYGAVRSVHVGDNNTLIAYCGKRPTRRSAPDTVKGLKFSKPSKYNV